MPVVEVADTVRNDGSVSTRREVGRDCVQITKKRVIAVQTSVYS